VDLEMMNINVRELEDDTKFLDDKKDECIE
jgi:hypothetical protein